MVCETHKVVYSYLCISPVPRGFMLQTNINIGGQAGQKMDFAVLVGTSS